MVSIRTDSEVAVVDISSGGALIESETRIAPGERCPVVVEVDGSRLTKIAGQVLRAEVARLTPTVIYRAAMRFAKPIGLGRVVSSSTNDWSAGTALVRDPLDVVPTVRSREAFEQELCRWLPIEAARIGTSLAHRPGFKSVYFMISGDETRYLQVFFTPTAPFEFQHFLLLEQWARAAGSLPGE